jgi:hypothetical protein
MKVEPHKNELQACLTMAVGDLQFRLEEDKTGYRIYSRIS